MDIKEPLTNESIRKKFKSQFELVNYAIKLADQLIRSGRSSRVHIDNQNPAIIIIEEIEEGKDKLEDIIVEAEKAAPVQSTSVSPKEMVSPPPAPATKTTERRKPRRILT